MSLGLRHLLNSILPVVIVIALAVIGISSYNSERLESLELEAADRAKLSIEKLDRSFYTISRAAAEFVNRRESLHDAISAVQESELTSFITAYESGLELNIEVSDLEGKILYQSWNPLSQGGIAPPERRHGFNANIIELEGARQLAVSPKIVNEKGEALGFLMVATKLDEKFLQNLDTPSDVKVEVGMASAPFVARGPAVADFVTATAFSKAIPDAWIKVYHPAGSGDLNLGRKRQTGSSLIFAVLLLLFFMSVYFIWKTNQELVIQPILKIESVILDNAKVDSPATQLDQLPNNEIGKLGRALLQQKNELAAQNKTLQDLTESLKKEAAMVKVLSHDLSTPITVIKYAVTKISPLLAAQPQGLGQLQKIEKQVGIIESILSHVKSMKALESGKVKLELSRLNFGQVISEASAAFKDKLEAKGMKLDWMPADEAAHFLAEPISFQTSVLANLLSNAIKFSERGSRIEVRCREVNGQTRMEVRDYGPGIPTELRPHLFSSTHATNRKGSEGESGTGFGMSIVRFYVQLYGGSIEFTTRTREESPTDHGTTFSIILKTDLNSVS